MKISISKGIEFFKTVEFKTVGELAKQACKTNISTSVFTDGKREIDSFEYAECIGLDIDNEPKDHTTTLTLEQAREDFKDFKHVILATRSHMKKKHGKVAERFRVILFLETPITEVDDFYATWHYLKSKFPAIDIQCKDPSRFWYKHSAILGGNDGKLIKPVKAAPKKEKVNKHTVTLPGQRGELAKATYKLLQDGVEPGSRNGSVHKAARDFNQNLYTQEEAESKIIEALERNDVFDSDFTDEEARAAIASAYSKDAKHAPRLEETEPRAFRYQTLGDLLSQPETKEDWIVDELLLKGGLSILVGVPKSGKTTLARQLEKSILRGEDFLGRKVQQGSVVHYSFDEKARTAKRHYRKLGLNESDKLILHFGSVENENYASELEEDFLKLKPTIAVIDTLFDMVDVEDVNSYGPIKKQMAYFSSLAERTECHILFIHHQNKPNQNYGRGSGHNVLGSTAIFGSVDCCMILERLRDSELREIAVQGRGVEDFDKLHLRFDKSTQMYLIEEAEDEF
jgi:hypothetical protein